MFGVVRTDRYPWTSPVTLTTLAVAAALLAAFVHVERTTTREPLIRLGLFANRSVAGANAYNLWSARPWPRPSTSCRCTSSGCSAPGRP